MCRCQPLYPLEAELGGWYAVLPLDLVPDPSVVRGPHACVVVGPVDHSVGRGVPIVRAVDVSARDVVVRVLLAVLDAGARQLPLGDKEGLGGVGGVYRPYEAGVVRVRPVFRGDVGVVAPVDSVGRVVWPRPALARPILHGV